MTTAAYGAGKVACIRRVTERIDRDQARAGSDADSIAELQLTQVNIALREEQTLLSEACGIPPAARGVGKVKSQLARPSTQQPVRISLAAAVADTTFLAGLRGELAVQQTVALTAESTGLDEALAIIDKDHPDVLILDANFVQMLPAVRLHSPKTKVILLAEQCRANILADALRLGARGCMSPRAPPREWLRAVRAVHAGEMWVGRRVLASVFDDLFMRVEGSGQPPAEPWGALSGRESQVANGVRLGLTNKEIARSLHISDTTVKTHIESIFHKLNITRRVQLATLTSERGMRPDEIITGAPGEG